MKITQIIHTSALFTTLCFSPLSLANPAALKTQNVPIEIPEPIQSIEKRIPSEANVPFERLFRRSRGIFRSERDRNVQTINKVLQSITELLKNDFTRPAQDTRYQPKQFVMPSLTTVREPISIIMDLKDIYWSLVRNEINVASANSKLQDYAFERLLVPDNHIGVDSVGDIDHTLKQTYEMLYQVRGESTEPPTERKQQINNLRQRLLGLRTPIVQAMYKAPLRIQTSHWANLKYFLKDTNTMSIISSNSQYAEEKSFMDMLRGLKVICERAKHLTEHPV